MSMTYLDLTRVWKERFQNKSSLPTKSPLFSKAFHATFLLFTLFAATNIYAATYTVNTTLDNESNGCSIGNCTLREAIETANGITSPGSDIINFAPSVTGTITLNGSALQITSDITINGPGARNLTISGNNLSRVFIVYGTLLNLTPTANINGLTIANGRSAIISVDGVSLSDGGGILNTNGGRLNLTEVTIRNNHSTTLGGGISTIAILLTTARTTITRSTISANTSTLGGGGVSNTGTELLSNATTTITNSTITNNAALAEGGGISNTLGDVNLINNTISDNQSVVAGGGIVNAGVSPLLGSAYLRNNIIARNSAVVGTDLISSDMLGTFTSRGNNLVGNNLSVEAGFAASVVLGGVPSPNVNGDIVGSVAVGFNIIYPLLGNLQNNGGPTNTRLPLVGSPALDNGNDCVTNSSCPSNNPPANLAFDQRGTGYPRVANTHVDIGATEGPAAPNAPYVVNSLEDNQSDGCGVAPGQCTLREAINASNVAPDYDTINFDPTLVGTIFLNGSQLVISSNVTINGLGARTLAVSGNNSSRVFLIAAPILGGDFEVNINGLTITQGTALPIGNLAGDGGGILNGALLGIVSGKSTLRLHEVNISNNLATTLGGGLATRLGSETIITNSLISANTTNGVPLIPGGDIGGGGISNAASTTVIANSTITNNNSLAAGGGILNAAGQLHLTNNTITHNESTLVGGGVVSLVGVVPPLGVTNLRNTIIAKNQSLLGANIISSDVLGVLGSFNSLGNNLIGTNLDVEVYFEASAFIGTSPQPNANLDLVGNVVIANQIIDPLLGPLQNNGGPTDSRLPSQLSPVINAGNNCVFSNTCAVNPAGRNPHTALVFDQRGNSTPRIMNIATEIGATEIPLAPTAAEVSISGRVLDSNNRAISNVSVRLTDSNGTIYTSVSNPFGYYRFENLSAGETVVITPLHKFYEFSPQALTLDNDLSNFNIFALSSNSKEGMRR